MKKSFLLFVAIFSVGIVKAQIDSLDANQSSVVMQDSLRSNEKALAIQQMNYHTISMSRIIRNQSLETLDYELFQLLNNLTIEHIVDLPEIKMYRENLMMSVQDLQVTAEERLILRRLQDLRQENLIWESVSKALNPTMILTSAGNPYQLAFYALLTAARGVVGYQSMSGQLAMEEIQALWELRKTDLGIIKELRSDAFSSIYDLYRRFKFKENVRLVEQDAEQYADILSENNAEKRLRLLLDNGDKFSHLLDYEYYLGMAYLDVEGYSAAKPHLEKYLTVYSQTPIFRKDEKSAFVYLTQLTYEQLSPVQIDDLINKIVHIIPNNGPALIQCVLKYCEIGMDEKGFNLIRMGLDNPYVSNKSSILMLSVCLSDKIKQYPKCWQNIQHCVLHCDDLSIDSYIAFLSCCSETIMVEKLNNIFKINDAVTRRAGLFGKKQLGEKYVVDISRKYSVDLNTISAYNEYSEGTETNITQAEFSFGDGVYTKEQLLKTVSAFKSTPKLLYNFFSPMQTSNYYRVKSGLDLSKEISHYNGAQSVDSKSERKLKKILKQDLKRDHYSAKCKPTGRLVEAFNIDSIFTLDFYKQWNYIPYYGYVKNTITAIKRDKNAETKINVDARTLSFRGKSLEYIPFPVYKIEERCIRIVLNDKIKSVITFVLDEKSGEVVPFSLLSNNNIYYLMDTSNMEKIAVDTGSKDNTVDEESSAPKRNWLKRVWNKVF